MVRIRQTAIVGTAALAVLAAGIAPASAAGTTIRSADDAPYSGNVQASLVGDATVSTSIGSGSCSQSTMTGSINSDGTGLSISSADFSSCTGTASVTITAQALPWTGGNVTYDPDHTDGRDATVTIANFNVKAVVNLFGGITCVFGGNLTANGYNPGNPVTNSDQAEVGVSGATVNKQSGSSFLCPSTATVTATYELKGETTAGSGTYDQTLHVTE
ncbi:hypothetical protein F8568_044590 [Actinomadura sp. LD22]|uniref:Tat pathway signal sequence domain protein n=1 Tax=Actinomadura physcomitrii TaxID=2650748 RepID=A0A6I4MN87_9ACTN|nr:hypothetical protein [Actinomadura physcomitrii]MWA07292.1 hypothetical protein [Actinomadura physcomitrii]